jgi:hypothetical protein
MEQDFLVCSHKKISNTAYLDVIAVISNPVRYESRYKLFTEFCDRMKKQPLVRLLTVELQQRHRPFITDSIVKLRSDHEIWYKENLINIGVQHLPEDWEYMAYIDADIEFQREDWVQETIEQLQTYDIVQLFSHAIDLGPRGETMTVHTGFCYLYVNGEPMNNYAPKTQYKNGHTGYGFAMRKYAYNAMGGLMEFCILGSADAHMCMGWIGKMTKTLHPKLHDNYKTLCMNYQERCIRHIKYNIGYVPGTILHYYHGPKKDRQYGSRWQILIKNNFDPLKDIKKNHNNLWLLEDYKPVFRDELRKYFRQRNEDSKEIGQDYNLVKNSWI